MPTSSRFVQRDEHAVRGEHAVVDPLQVVVADRRTLTAHDADQFVEETTLGDECIGQRIDR